METVTFSDFEKLDIRVGTVLEVLDFPEAKKPAWKLRIDFGDLFGIKNSSAQIVDLYNHENLINRQVLAVVNFSPKQVGKFMSEVLVLGIVGENEGVVLINPERKVKNGAKIG
jgi:tRNA-binding protein